MSLIDETQPVETTERIGYEWALACNPVEPLNVVLIQSSVGPLILVRIEKYWRETEGGFRRVPVKPEELEKC